MNAINFPKEVKLIPETPGIYQFKNKDGVIIYIGKAKNLKNRVKSYTMKDLLPKTAKMVENAVNLSYIEVQSEFEALLLEARLVRKYMPVYNIELKDDKSPLYIGITKEEYPRILTFRQTDLQLQNLKTVFGPYVDGKSTKYVLRLLRKVFPYSQHKVGKKACIYFEIGLCNPCPSVIAHIESENEKTILRKEYLRNIRRIVMILSGKFNSVSADLHKEMQMLSKNEDFENAEEIKRRISYLEAVTKSKPKINEYIKNPNLINEIHDNELSELTNLVSNGLNRKIKSINRIECFDIAHLAGSNPVASMVTFIDGVSDKRFYRHFKINLGKNQNSDVDSMKEVLSRRMKHFDDWGKPDLLIIDGGKPQVTVAIETLGNDIPVVGLAKRYETFVYFTNNEFIEKLLPEGGAKNLVVRIRNEAHRFARRLHHNLVTKTLLGEI